MAVERIPKGKFTREFREVPKSPEENERYL